MNEYEYEKNEEYGKKDKSLEPTKPTVQNLNEMTLIRLLGFALNQNILYLSSLCPLVSP
jgi:hypothetical protein